MVVSICFLWFLGIFMRFFQITIIALFNTRFFINVVLISLLHLFANRYCQLKICNKQTRTNNQYFFRVRITNPSFFKQPSLFLITIIIACHVDQEYVWQMKRSLSILQRADIFFFSENS